MKGILLAGGSGSRLHPITQVVSKQLLPVYDKPMVYYPLSTLILAGIREVLVITTPDDQTAFRRLLGHGSRLGMQIEYAVQPSPDGLAQAFIIGRDFIGDGDVALALGDNIFYGHDFQKLLGRAVERHVSGATVFATHVSEPERYGVVGFGRDHVPTSIEEKPKEPKSNWAVTGLYLYDNEVVHIAAGLQPSARGELEITDVNREYLAAGKLRVELLGRGIAWLDTGTPESLLQAGAFVQTLEERQGVKIGCIEEAAYAVGFISLNALKDLTTQMPRSAYGRYLQKVVSEEWNLVRRDVP